MGIQGHRFFYLIIMSLLLVPFQNCGRASFRNLDLASGLKAVNGDNGSVFDGKLTFYQMLPDYSCEGQLSARSFIRFEGSKALFTFNQNDHCGALLDQTIPSADIDSSKFDSDFIGYRDAIYERGLTQPDVTSSEYNEVLCQSTSTDSLQVDVAIKFSEKNQLAQSKIYYDKNGQARNVPYFKVLREVTSDQARYTSASFDLIIDRSQPSPQKWWYFLGTLNANLETGAWQGPVRCRMQAGKLLTSVQKLYAKNGDWNSYVAQSNTMTDQLRQPDVACLGASNLWTDCFHGGDKLVVRTESKKCSDVKIKDSLNAFDWNCEDQATGAVFYASKLKLNRSLSDLVTSSGWRDNFVQISDPQQIIYESMPMAWWKNKVLPLPSNPTGSSVSLNQLGAVYVAEISSASQGYSIDQNQISLVIKPGATLSAAPNLAINCNDIGSPSAPNGYGPPLRCLVYNNGHSFTWIEGDFTTSGSNASAALKLSRSSFLRLQNIKASGSLGYGIYQSWLMSSVFNQVSSDSNQFGLVSYFSEGNLMDQISLQNNSYTGLVFGAWDNNNTITNSKAINNGIYGFEMISALNLKMSVVRASNHSNSGIALEGFTDNGFFDSLFLTQNGFGLNVMGSSLGTKIGHHYQNITLVGNNTGMEMFKEMSPAVANNEKFSGYFRQGNTTDCLVLTIGTGAYRSNTCPGTVALGSELYSWPSDFKVQNSCRLSADGNSALCGN